MISVTGGERSVRSNRSSASRTRWKTNLLTMAVAGASFSFLLANTYGATIEKANNATNLTLGASWVGSVAPGANDVAQWNNTVTAANSTSLGGTMSLSGITILNPGGAVTISDPSNALTLGSAGIDMSNATQSLTIDAAIAMSTAQTWNVGAGASLTVNNVISGTAVTGTTPALTKIGDGTLTLTAANTYTGTSVFQGGSTILDFTAAGTPAANIIPSTEQLQLGGGSFTVHGGSGNVQSFAGTTIAPGLTTFNVDSGAVSLGSITGNNGSGWTQGGTVMFNPTGSGSVTTSSFGNGSQMVINGSYGFATVGLDDWAAKDANGNIVGLSTIANGYNTAAATTFAGSIDVQPGAVLVSPHAQDYITSIRFNSPTAGFGTYNGNTMDILVAQTNNNAFIVSGAYLITPNVGDNDVLITNNLNNPLTANPSLESSRSGRAGDMIMWQNNTQGLLILEAGMWDSKTVSASFTESGPGSIVSASLNNQNRAGIFINEGSIQIYDERNIADNGTTGAVTLTGGGTLIGTATFALDDGTALHPVVVQGNGGLVATNQTTMTINGVVSGYGTLSFGNPNGILGASFGGTTGGVVSRVTRVGDGTVVLNGVNTYVGNATVKAGSVYANNSFNVGGTTTVNSGAAFGGTGTTGNLIVNAGGIVNPGSNDGTPGTLTAANLTVGNGVVFNYEFTPTANDVINVNQMAITGTAGVNLLAAGTTSSFFSPGGYTLFNVAGATAAQLTTLASQLTVLNGLPADSGWTYTFSTDASNDILLAIKSPSILGIWKGSASKSWTGSTSNWSYGATPPVTSSTTIPQFAFDVAQFDSTGASKNPVTVDGTPHVGGIIFNSSTAYTINAGADGSAIIMDASTAVASISDTLGSHTINAPVQLASAVNVTVSNGQDTLTIAGPISGAFKLTKLGIGTLVFTGTNTYDNTAISDGTLQIGDGATAGAGTLGAGTVLDNSVLSFQRPDTINVTNVISGTGVVQQNTGTLTLSAANTYTGGTQIVGGVVQMGNANAVGTGFVNLGFNGTLDVNGLTASVAGLSGPGTVLNNGATPGTLALGSNNSSTFGGVLMDGTNVLALDKVGGGTLVLTNRNTFTGGTTIDGGALLLQLSNALAGTITVDTGGVLQLGSNLGSPIANTLVQNNAGDLVDLPTEGSATLSGAISTLGTNVYQMGVNSSADPENPSLGNTGTIVLTGASTTTSGTANISEGNVTYGAGGSLVLAGTVTVGTAGNAQLLVSGTGALIQATTFVISTNASSQNIVTVANGGIIDLGTGTLNMDASNATPLSNQVSMLNLNTGGTLKVGNIIKSVTGVGTYAQINFYGGTLMATQSGTILPGLNNLSVLVRDGGAIVDTSGFNVTIASDLQGSGNGGLTKNGTGLLLLTGTNNYNGTTLVNAGTLQLGNANAIGNSALLNVVGGVPVDLNGKNPTIGGLTGNGTVTTTAGNNTTLTISGNTSNSFAGTITQNTGTMTVIKIGNGVQTLTGFNNFGGKLIIEHGAINLAANNVLDNIGGPIIVTTANGLQFSSSVGLGNAVQIGSTSNPITALNAEFEDVTGSANATIGGLVTLANGSYMAGISGSGSLTFTGTQNGLTGATTDATITRGNINYSRNAFMQIGRNLIVGDSTSAVNMTITQNALVEALAAQLGTSTVAQDDMTLTMAGNGTLALGAGVTPDGTGILGLNSSSSATSVGTLQLDGGSLDVGGFSIANSTGGTAVVNFNGGTVVAGQDNTAFFGSPTLVSANIQAGGAKFNDNGHNVTIGADINGDVGDGGFTKSGSGNLTLTGAVNYTGSTNVQSGQMTFAGTGNSVAGVTGAGTVNVSGDLTSDGITASALNITGQATIRANGTDTGTSKVNTLTITGPTATLDINDNKMIVESNSGTKAATIANLQSLVTSGNLTSSLLAANDTIFVADNGSGAGGTAVLSSFGGQTADANSILVMADVLGDANLDEKVTTADLTIWANNYGDQAATWLQGDYNGDGKITTADLTIWANNYGQTFNPVVAPALGLMPASTSSVPEPASLAVLGIGAAALLTRRRRK